MGKKRINMNKYSTFNIRCNTRCRILSTHLSAFVHCHGVSKLILTFLTLIQKKYPALAMQGIFDLSKLEIHNSISKV